LKTDMEVVTTKGTINQGNAIACTFDPTGTAHLMSLLTNLYSNAPKAVLREYSTNAYDSHVEAGVNRPIEVTLPNYLQPNLHIKDYGVGLSKDEIINIYSRYGASTKRETNDQVGAFGIGSKAAFTIGQQFIVTGVKDREKTTALFALGQDGVGTVNILEQKKTDEPNGVLVSIGINNPSLMKQEANEFFKTWEPGTVLVNGQEPDSILGKSFQVTPDTYILEGISGLWVSMGVIAYPVSSKILANLNDKASSKYYSEIMTQLLRDYGYDRVGLYFKVPIGDIDITPSRESIRDTNKTIDSISNKFAEFLTNIEKTLADELSVQPTLVDAAKYLANHNNRFGRLSIDVSRLEWNGQPVNSSIKIAMPGKYTDTRGSVDILRNIDDIRIYWTTIDTGDILVITNTPEKPNTYGLKKYMLHNDYKTAIFAPDAEGEIEWFSYGPKSRFDTLDYSLLREETKKIPSTTVKSETTYSTTTKDFVQYMTAKEIAALNIPIYYFRKSITAPNSLFISEWLQEDVAFVCYVNSQTENGLKKRLPNAVPGKEELLARMKTFVDGLTDEQLSKLQNSEIIFNIDTLTEYLQELTNVRTPYIEEFFKSIDDAKQFMSTDKDLISKYKSAKRFLSEETIKIVPPSVTIDDIWNRYVFLKDMIHKYYSHRVYDRDVTSMPTQIELYVKAVEENLKKGEINAV
jgi:hypothetical protein